MNEVPHIKGGEAYYLTLFMLNGHTRWRAHFSTDPEGYKKEQGQWNKKTPSVTNKRVIRIDRITGELHIKE